MNKFLNVDVIDILNGISNQISLGSHGLSKADISELFQMVRAQPDGPLNMIWTCEPSGSNIFDERDAYMQNTTISGMLGYFLDESLPWNAKLYGVEVTATKDKRVLGNIYEYDPQQYAQFAAQSAQPYTDLTLTFADGIKLCVPKDTVTGKELDQLEAEHGKIVCVRRETANEAAIQSALHQERTLFNAVPPRDVQSYLQKLGEQQIQTTAEQMISQLQRTNTPNYPHPSVKAYVVAVPRELWGAESQKLHQLMLKLQELVDDPNLFIGQISNVSGLFAITNKPGRKQSIKDRLVAPPSHSGTAPTKAKNREER